MVEDRDQTVFPVAAGVEVEACQLRYKIHDGSFSRMISYPCPDSSLAGQKGTEQGGAVVYRWI